jgi:hypothetical protein
MTALLPKIFVASINASYFKPLDLRHPCLLCQILICWQAITLDSLEQTSNRYLKEKEPSRRLQRSLRNIQVSKSRAGRAPRCFARRLKFFGADNDF